jgi:hypothetical protein
MNFVSYDIDYGPTDDQKTAREHLQFELGWTEVRRGLGLILRGYFLIIGGAILLGVAIAVLLMIEVKERNKIPWQVREVGPFLGLALFGILCLYAYGCIVVGHWRCLMNVPERCGARWLMFGCLTCILAGPALNFAAGFTGVQTQPKIERGLDGIKDVKYSTEGAVMQIGSIGVAILGNVLFILFLRAIARCFEDSGRVILVNLYLLFTGLLLAGSIYLPFAKVNPALFLPYVLALGMGWVLNFFGYLAVVFIIRWGITSGLTRLGWRADPFAAGRA